ncbi:MAG: type I-C CRISPR-associated protein Cas8c/Csd1 [Candidatus Babeliaceae bacterium]|nr:type I-C CRISPR-associated protein Cas8c/Csd1 [Candidatus Babeliaceae bacterium]
MSWIQKLHETYDACAGNENIPDIDELCPVGYSVQNAHIEVVIDHEGNFRRASLVDKNNTKTLIPVTEKSLTGRTSGIAPHPLCDSLQYCAGDYEKYGDRESYFVDYFTQLESWANSKFSHEKVKAVYGYVSKNVLIKDLYTEKLLAEKDGKLAIFEKTDEKKKVKVTAPSDNDTPVIVESDDLHPIIKLLAFDDKGIKNQAKVFIRWKVEAEGALCSETWKDKTLFDAWANYLSSFDSIKGFCYVTGKTETEIAQKHPAKLRSGRDGAKLISSNDTSGFTYFGRFKSVNEAASVSSEVTQKAHSALRWLIGRKQAFRSGDQVFVAWATTGKQIPDPCANSWDFLGDKFQLNETSVSIVGDVGQGFAKRFKKKLAGYKANITDTDDIVVMGLDSATPGRMAMTFYRELTGSEFLERIEKWHVDFAWLQNYGKDREDKKRKILFEGAPAPRDIAWCAYGKKVEGKNGIKLLNSTVERLMPSIIDGRPVPRDLVEQCVRRVSNRAGLEPWEFEKCLGIACSQFKGFYIERGYVMGLEEDRSTRDYLYGRLLAVAEKMEGMALFLADESRETTAARLMQRFADRPYSTWRTIETSLVPYRARLNNKVPGLLKGYMELLDQICCKFTTDEFKNDSRLSGEYLLGYHCQRKWLNEHKRLQGQWILKAAEDEDDLANRTGEQI